MKGRKKGIGQAGEKPPMKFQGRNAGKKKKKKSKIFSNMTSKFGTDDQRLVGTFPPLKLF